jgi:hydroxymethylpyrimidine/phosphomethylpyrimidine kinase
VRAVLSIAGSDSGGGAGIQADLKAFAACRVHGMTAITAITAQNTVGVTDVHAIPPATIVAQIRAVAADIRIDAVKIGMLGTAATIEAVRQGLSVLPPGVPIVIDPVMVSESGAELLEPHARHALIERLLPLATVVTPNLPEARALTGDASGGQAFGGATSGGATSGGATSGGEAAGVRALAAAIRALGPAVVVITGGHRDAATDLYFDGEQAVEIPGARYPDGAAHGSGCTHSSVLAAWLALGHTPLEAAREAKRRAALAVANGLREIGAGAGPVDVLAAHLQ